MTSNVCVQDVILNKLSYLLDSIGESCLVKVNLEYSEGIIFFSDINVS